MATTVTFDGTAMHIVDGALDRTVDAFDLYGIDRGGPDGKTQLIFLAGERVVLESMPIELVTARWHEARATKLGSRSPR